MKRYILLICTLVNLAHAMKVNDDHLKVQENKCAQYQTCKECLDLQSKDPFGVGARPDCGWCHVKIEYADGSKGARCADITDTKHWNCGDQFDTAQCSPGWACDETQKQCIVANPGDGFGSKSSCEEYCGPHHGPSTYRCNTTSYTCDECKDGDKGCNPDRAVECDNCKDPDANKMFKCNKTDKENPKCNECPSGNQTDCHPKEQECASCHPKNKLFKCNETTFKCEQTNSTGGNIKAACDQSCTHHTPSNLLGTWRGLMAKKGKPSIFDMGELDLVFGDKNLTVKYPNRTQVVYDVATSGGGSLILQKDNQTIRVVNNVLAYLKHTLAMGLSTFGPGKDAPYSFHEGMSSDDALSLTMWKCLSWGKNGTCEFKAKPPAEPVVEKKPAALKDVHDKCNEYGDCNTCIGASGDITCGWCLGGTLSYQGIGKTPFKCGGFAKGQPFNFTCPADFRTTNCQGYQCDFTKQTCSKTDDGQFPDNNSCMDVCTKNITHAKCNEGTKKCESCTEGSTGCNTAAFCEATCGQPHAKCNPSTGKCADCDPETDKDCTQTKPACEQECSVMTLAKCDKESGKCFPCKSGDGCVPDAACENTCSHQHKDKYRCNWNTTQPTCVQDEKGSMTKEACASSCEVVKFAKCDFDNNTCVNCTRSASDPDCIQTMDYCKIAQKEGKCKRDELNGLFRMIEVQTGYDKGEFDVLFKDGKMYMQDFETNITAKDLGDIKSTGTAESGGITFKVDNWKPNPKIWNNAKMFGVYKKSFGEDQVFNFLEMAIQDHEIKTLDDGLTGRYFIGVQCKKDSKICDFTKATPNPDQSPQLAGLFAKYKFFLG